MSIDIRAITLDEAPEFRRVTRAGFGFAETSDEDGGAWAREFTVPVERCLAAYDGGRMVATLRSFPNELTVPGAAQVPVGALTSVTCGPTHRRQGILTRMITQDLRASAERGEVADVLIASEWPIYGRFGYGPAVEATKWELSTKNVSFAYEGEGTVELIDNDELRKEAPAIFDRVRAMRPGMINRRELVWDVAADVRRAPEDKPWAGFRVLCRDDHGTPQGWASWTVKPDWDDMVPNSTAAVSDLCAATPAAEARLWRFLAGLDLVRTVVAGDRPADELLPLLLTDGRAAKQTFRGDFIWVRPLDVARALEARTYDVAGKVVLEVTDDLGIAEGRYELDATPDGATCRRTDKSADLTMPMRTLGAAYLGGTRVRLLHATGWLDATSREAVETADALFASSVTPWCNTWF